MEIAIFDHRFENVSHLEAYSFECCAQYVTTLSIFGEAINYALFEENQTDQKKIVFSQLNVVFGLPSGFFFPVRRI